MGRVERARLIQPARRGLDPCQEVGVAVGPVFKTGRDRLAALAKLVHRILVVGIVKADGGLNDIVVGEFEHQPGIVGRAHDLVQLLSRMDSNDVEFTPARHAFHQVDHAD